MKHVPELMVKIQEVIDRILSDRKVCPPEVIVSIAPCTSNWPAIFPRIIMSLKLNCGLVGRVLLLVV
jgi:hypothetical protein